MAKLTVTQATSVKMLIAYLSQSKTSAGAQVADAEDAESALAILARDAFERMMAGPRGPEGRAAIAAVEQQRELLSESQAGWKRELKDNARLDSVMAAVRKLHWEHEGRCANCITWCDCDSDIVARHQHNVPWPCSTAKALAIVDAPAAESLTLPRAAAPDKTDPQVNSVQAVRTPEVAP